MTTYTFVLTVYAWLFCWNHLKCKKDYGKLEKQVLQRMKTEQRYVLFIKVSDR